MRGYVLQMMVAMLLATGLASCAQKPVRHQPTVYEVTEASVTLSKAADPRLKDELQRRMEATIAISHRGAPMPRVYLDVAVLNTRFGQGGGGFENTARVQVIARRPETNEPVHLREFEAVTYTNDRSLAYAGLAESIAAHIRYEFALATPDPQAYAPEPRTSTILESELSNAPAQQHVTQPRAGGDALLNANTRFGASGEIELRREPAANPQPASEPCIVTAENDCSEMFDQ